MTTFTRGHHAKTGLSGNHTYDVDRATQQAQDNTTTYATAAGDTRKLRGIPAIGRGVTGAINGTNPQLALQDV